MLEKTIIDMLPDDFRKKNNINRVIIYKYKGEYIAFSFYNINISIMTLRFYYYGLEKIYIYYTSNMQQYLTPDIDKRLKELYMPVFKIL